MLSKASIGLVGALSPNLLVFWETLDFCGNFLVLFMVLENIFEPRPSLRSFGRGYF